MTHRFDLIAFDWDGTLSDSTALIVRCIQAACRDVGAVVPSDTQAAYVIGLGLQDALRHAVPALPPDRYAELGQRYRHHYIACQHEVMLFDWDRRISTTDRFGLTTRRASTSTTRRSRAGRWRSSSATSPTRDR
jgi:phosphoglycolate phosphatase-like HAD superfamily hydrolase